MSDRRQPDAIEPPDPFEGLVLDEEFVRSATVSEPSARARMLAGRWRREPPVDPGGRRWSPDGPAPARGARTRRFGGRGRRLGGRFGSLSRGERWTAVLGVLIVLLVAGGLLFGPNRAHTPQLASPAAHPGGPQPASDRALPDGGVFAGSQCGRHGYHRYPDAPGSVAVGGSPGPGLSFDAYGYQRLNAAAPGEFVFDLLVAPGAGSAGPMALAAPLGREGVAVEIEGPDGVVAAAYGLPAAVTGAAHTPDGQGWLVTGAGASAHVVLPVAAVCPGVDAEALTAGMRPPTDATGTVTGPAPYTLTVSVSDPEVAELRRTLGVPPRGAVLAVTNQLLQQDAKPV